MNKRIGLVTCFINNYGACLQAYALQRTIISLGYECEIIKYVEPKSYDKHSGVLNRLLKNQITRMCLMLLSRQYRQQMKSRRKFNQFRIDNLIFSKEEFASAKSLGQITESYDAYVCGSDQIWNPVFCGKYFYAYMLAFVTKQKKIAYAPSIGLNNIPVEWENVMTDYLGSFSALSCREETGSELIRKITNKQCRTVLDPTLLLDRNVWSGFVDGQRVIKNNYVFCYLFDDRDFYKSFIVNTCRSLKATPVIIPFTEKQKAWSFTIIDNAGPKEFVSLIKFASFVITDSFHATAFSINLNTPFYSLVRNLYNGKIDMRSRIIDVLSLTQLEGRLLLDDSYDPNDIDYAVDFSKSNVLLKDKRDRDIRYLKEALDK